MPITSERDTAGRAWTPGPWEVNAARTADQEFMVCAGSGHEYGLVASALTENDARLIAAAPDLYEALDVARKWLVINDDPRCQSDLKAIEATLSRVEVDHG